ncbi:MAG: isoprenyl transferase [Vulcanimicrobiota bacterium]
MDDSLDLSRLPRHVAVIMDGNRRWAKERKLPVLLGHRAGVKSFRRVLETCRELGIRHLTAYAFSAENWRRAPAEVRVLMQLFEQYTRREREKLRRTGICFRTIGRIELLPPEVWQEFRRTEEATADNRDMILNLAVNYGSRDEIVEAARRVSRDLREGKLQEDELDEERFGRYLWTGDQPDPDLLIRTSGELRVSNFLLWQLAYTEFYFTPLYWPDIDRRVLMDALLEYQQRERRYGGTAVSS